MLGVITKNRQQLMMVNKIIVHKGIVCLRNTITGEELLSKKSTGGIGHTELKKTVKRLMNAGLPLQLDLDYVNWLQFNRKTTDTKQSLVNYMSRKHMYVLKSDGVDEVIRIDAYKQSGILLTCANKDYVIKERDNEIQNIHVLEQINYLKTEVFLALSRSKLVFDIQDIIRMTNERGTGVFVEYILNKDGTLTEIPNNFKDA